MSSILEALKKLEKEKLHRDEISTAIASDILRSGAKPKPAQWKIPLALFLSAIIISCLAFFFTRSSDQTVDLQSRVVSDTTTTSSVVVRPVVTPEVVPPPKEMPIDLPLLSGIVYQREAEARMAILNDLPVMEGTEIAGYTLKQIFPDHVTLSRHGQTFDLYMSTK